MASDISAIGSCSFCGKATNELTDEHVISRCLYDWTVTDPKVQRLVVPACAACNNSWSKDETTFRNAVALTTYTRETNAIFPKVIRSITEAKYAGREAERMRNIVREIDTPTGRRRLIYPGGAINGPEGAPKPDPGILRVIRKIVRGYCYANMGWPVADNKVIASIMPSALPDDFKRKMNYDHRDPNIFQCWFGMMPERDKEFESCWAMCFYQNVYFGAMVARPSSFRVFDHG